MSSDPAAVIRLQVKLQFDDSFDILDQSTYVHFLETLILLLACWLAPCMSDHNV